MSDKFYNKLMDNLRSEPLLSAFIGIVFILFVGGGGAYLALKDSRDSNPATLVAVLVLGVLLMFLVLAYMIVGRDKGRSLVGLSAGAVSTLPPDSVLLNTLPDSRIRALSDAIDQLKKIVGARWIKSDLRFDLTISRIPGDSANASMTLSASFKVVNVTSEPIEFFFLTEVEVQPGTADKLRGHLSVKLVEKDVMTHDVDISLKSIGPNVRRHKHAPTILEPHHAYQFSWSLEPYVVPLPYCEYWASAHPVINMRVSVHRQEEDIKASAVVYRPGDQGEDDDPSTEGNPMSWHSRGVFLPYQGVLLKIFRA